MPNWISVKERLPEYNKEVLVYYKYDEFPIQAYLRDIRGVWHGSRAVRDCMNNGYVEDSMLSNQDDIAYWMPLPEPPKTTTP